MSFDYFTIRADFIRRSAVLALAAVMLTGCTTAELAIDLIKKRQKQQEKEQITQSVESGSVKAAPRYKIGNPYKVAGVWYYPERDLSYDETGIGSWYGDEFAGRLTANGEIFDPNMVTAAHKTLPMPSVVRVTNLDNGKSLVVRVNDRGPFVAGRIIDLSREAARLIGYKDAGIARVRVQLLAEQSLRLEQQAKEGKFPDIVGGVAEPMPEITTVEQPEVSFTAVSKTRDTDYAANEEQSAIDLLSRSRVGEVIDVVPVQTSIWVQIGAFHAQSNAANVLTRVSETGAGEVAPIERNGQTLYRVRIGPINDVAMADDVLNNVFKLGFSGARIVVD